MNEVNVIPCGTIINANNGIEAEPWQSGIQAARVKVQEVKVGFNVFPFDKRRKPARKEDK